MDKEIKRLKGELLDVSFISMSYKVFYNPSFSVLLECMQSVPLMFGNTLTVIHLDEYLIGNKLSFEDKQIESIDYSLSKLDNRCNIIFVCKIPRNENKKPDSRKKIYKTLSKYAQVREFVQFRTYQKGLNTQIAQMAKEKDLVISSSDIELFIEQSGSNLTLIDSELEKLKITVYPSKVINSKAIKKYCTFQEDVFMLANLIIQGDKNKILKQYDLLTEKRHPLEIFAVLQNNFQKFVFLKIYEKKMNIKDMASKQRLPEFTVKTILGKLQNTALDTLINIRRNLTEAEYKIKTGQSASEKTELELVLLR